MRSLTRSTLLLAGLALAGCHKAEAPPAAAPELRLLATGDTWGQVEPCG